MTLATRLSLTVLLATVAFAAAPFGTPALGGLNQPPPQRFGTVRSTDVTIMVAGEPFDPVSAAVDKALSRPRFVTPVMPGN